MAFRFLIHLFALAIIIVVCNACPDQCRCRNSRVKCHRLLTLPVEFPEKTTKIAFDQTALEEIPANAFSGLTSLVTVEFTNCAISIISERTFSEMNSLRNLRFETCLIDHIQKHAFAFSGRRLKIEFMDSIIKYIHSFAFFGIYGANMLNWKSTKIYNLLPSAFYNVTGLKKLIFDSCEMTIGNMAFNGIHALQELKIRNTYFNTLACNGITEILKANFVQLSGNRINCDCGIEWIIHEKPEVCVESFRWFLQTTTCGRPTGYSNLTMEKVLSNARDWCTHEIRNQKTACLSNFTSADVLVGAASTEHFHMAVFPALFCLMRLTIKMSLTS